MPPRGAQALIRERTRLAVVNRRVFPYLALVTLVSGLLAGVVVTIIAPEDFRTLEDGIWWAIVTLGTVGYGDIVPTTTWGRVIGSVVIVFGITFISFLTATVTSLFVAAEQREARERERQRAEAADVEMRQLLVRVDERLAAIEAKLGRGA
jgi:voltage-gated potassium channel